MITVPVGRDRPGLPKMIDRHSSSSYLGNELSRLVNLGTNLLAFGINRLNSMSVSEVDFTRIT